MSGCGTLVRKARLVAGALVVLVGLALLLPSAQAVDKAPDVSLVDVDGDAFKLSDYRGEVLMLDFFFLACAPCKELAHDLDDLHRKNITDFNLLSIDTFPADSDAAIKQYADENGYQWRFTKDNEKNDAQRRYSTVEYPTIVIIDRDGYITYKASGSVSIDRLEEEVDKALKGEAEPIAPVQLGLVAFAFAAGLASFFSPCAFPLLPGYITYYFKVGTDAGRWRAERTAQAGEAPGEERVSAGRQVATGLRLGTVSGGGIVLVYFVLGVIVIGLLALGVTSLSGEAIGYLKPVVGVILVVMGVLTTMDIAINTGYITAPFRRIKDMVRPRKGPQKPTFDTTGLFLYGVGYGSASASCSAPIFIALAVTAIATGKPQDAAVTFIVFLFSLWLLMVVVSVVLTMSEERVKSGLMKHYILVKKVTGVVFVIAGAYLLYSFLAAEGIVP